MWAATATWVEPMRDLLPATHLFIRLRLASIIAVINWLSCKWWRCDDVACVLSEVLIEIKWSCVLGTSRKKSEMRVQYEIL